MYNVFLDDKRKKDEELKKKRELYEKQLNKERKGTIDSLRNQ